MLRCLYVADWTRAAFHRRFGFHHEDYEFDAQEEHVEDSTRVGTAQYPTICLNARDFRKTIHFNELDRTYGNVSFERWWWLDSKSLRGLSA